MSNRTARTERA